MNTTLGTVFLVVMASLKGVTGFTTKEGDLGTPKPGQETANCNYFKGTCIPLTDHCDGDLKNGTSWCFNKKKYGCCIPKVCNSNSKCGDRGGFCIPKDKPCNGNEIVGDGYCSDNGNCKCCLGPTVYMKDIENTITYALKNRAVFEEDGPNYKILNRTQLIALKNFIDALTKNLQLRTPVKNILDCLKPKLVNLAVTIGPQGNTTGHKIKNEIDRCEKDEDFYLNQADKLQWIGCRNAFNADWQRVRTYPCGVWTTFHAMSVNLNETDPNELLTTLHGFVKYFPWCMDCWAHFLKMYVGDVSHPEFYIVPAANATTKEEVITWLWHAHNIVNRRVPYSVTQFPTPGRSHLVFPGPEQCVPKVMCFNSGGSYDTDKIITYLKGIYQQDAIITIE